MRKKKIPILEFDPSRKAIIEPSAFVKTRGGTDYCVLCFFKDIVEKVAAGTGARIIYEDKGVYGTNPLYRFKQHGHPVIFFNPLMGASISAAFLELAIGLGCRRIIACGSAGVLDKNIPVGGFVVPSAAIRDEGTSFHYLPAGREITVNRKTLQAITSTLKKHHQPFTVTKTWTTDGLFRETPQRIALRKREGCAAVEMEAAALLAVAQFRKVKLGYILSGGDDVSGEVWDTRGDLSRMPARERLFWLSVEACLRL